MVLKLGMRCPEIQLFSYNMKQNNVLQKLLLWMKLLHKEFVSWNDKEVKLLVDVF